MSAPGAVARPDDTSAPALLGKLGPLVWPHRYLLAAFLVALSTCGIVFAFVLRFPLPSGSDPGQWLQLANAMLGVGRTSLSPFQYPPGLPLLIAAFKLVVGDPVLALYATLATITIVVPLCAYASYFMIVGDRRGALFFSVFIGFNQGFFDMLAWGGYPNYLSFGPFLLALAYLVRTSREGATRKDAFLLGLLTGLVFVIHPLTSLMLGTAGLAFVGLRLFLRWDWKWIKALVLYALPPFAVLYGPFLYLRAANNVVSASYLTAAPVYSLGSAWHPFVPWRLRPFFPFDAAFTVPLTLLFVGLALFPLLGVLRARGTPPIFAKLRMPGNESAHRDYYLLFLAVWVPPLMLPVAIAAAGYGADFARAMYYPYVPVAAILAALFAAWSHRGADREAARRVVHALRVLRRGVAAHQHPSRHPRLTKLLHDRLGTVMLLLVVFTIVNTNIRYLDLSVAYYSRYDQKADFELATWLHDQLGVDERILLSPDEENQVSYNWLAGLTERQVLAYTQPAWLFYGAERTRNHEIFQMFNNRLAIGGRSLEVSTQGVATYSDFQMRVTVLARLAEFPAVEFEDFRTTVELLDGSSMLVTNFSQRYVSFAAPNPTTLVLVSHAFDRASGVSFDRTAALDGDELVITLSATERGQPLHRLHMWAVPSAPMCSVDAAGNVVVWKVQDGGLCHTLTGTVSPSMVANMTGEIADMTVDLSDNGTAQMRFSGEPVESGYTSPTRVYDSSLLFETNKISDVVLLKKNLYYATLLHGEYGFPLVYENSKYIVLEARPAG